MSERRIEILEEKTFLAISGENGRFPPAPDDAVLEYERLKGEWQMTFPRSEEIEPIVSLYPQRRDGRLVYVVAKEIVISK